MEKNISEIVKESFANFQDTWDGEFDPEGFNLFLASFHDIVKLNEAIENLGGV